MSANTDRIRLLFQGDLTRNIYEIVSLVFEELLDTVAAAVTIGQVQQPAGRTVSGTTDTILPADIGNVVTYTQAGGVTVSINSLAADLISGRAEIITLQATDAATALTLDPGPGVTIDGSTSNFVASVGRARVSLISLDGLAFYSGTP